MSEREQEKAYWLLSETIRKALSLTESDLDIAARSCRVVKGKRYAFTAVHTEVLNDIRPTIRVTPAVGAFGSDWHRHDEVGLRYFHVPPAELLSDIVYDAENV